MDVNRDYAGGYGTARLVSREDYGHSFDLVFPVFMPYLASKMKKEGYQFKIVDAQAWRLNLKTVMEQVLNEGPNVLVSMLSLPSIYGDIDALNQIKDKFPKIRLVAVGTVTKVLTKEIIDKGGVDFLVSGEYPFYSDTVIRLIQALENERTWSMNEIPGLTYRKNYGGNTLIEENQGQPSQARESLDDLDLSVYREFPMKKYVLRFLDSRGRALNYFPILSGRGCPFSCIYCPYPVGFGKKVSTKSALNVVNEMEFLNKEFGIRAFVFRDQVFTANKQRVEEICRLILDRGLDVNWLVETRLDRISRSLLRQMKTAGCSRVHYGVETGDQNLLRRVGKPGVSTKTVKDVFSDTSAEGIYAAAHVILGLPGENKETLFHTYRLLSEIHADSVSWNLVTPYPGTRLFEMAKEKNLILSYNWEKYSTEEPVMRTQELSGRELVEFRNKYDRKLRTRRVIKRTTAALRSKKGFVLLIRGMVFKLRRMLRSFLIKDKILSIRQS
jgi:radical SAM superfamily enzyme YgiQ (UPF0313 family)